MSYILRLDDACEHCDKEKWDKIEHILDRYDIKPLVGIIPYCQDPEIQGYDIDERFWKKTKKWEKKGWVLGLHGCYHLYKTKNGGLNPIHNRSEFAGQSLKTQRNLIKVGCEKLLSHGIKAKVFFAPSHTFDKNTIIALKKESKIRIISDTIAIKSYRKYGVTFVPQQVSKVRKIPFLQVTFCYHPNMMCEKDFYQLENFLRKHYKEFIQFPVVSSKRKESILDILLRKIYFYYHARLKD